jgi:arginyl-tRNA synthetase
MHLGVVVAVLFCGSAVAQYKAINPEVKRVVDAVSEERIAATMKKLESFGTRNTVSEGAAPAAQWILEEMKTYSPRLEVSFDTYKVKKQGRVTRDIELRNVVAVLPGTSQKERHVIV